MITGRLFGVSLIGVLVTGGGLVGCAQTGGTSTPDASGFPSTSGSGGTSAPAGSPAPASPEREPASASAGPSASPFVGDLSAVECLRHRYRMTRFVAIDPNASEATVPYRAGSGGGVVIAFTNRRLPDSANVQTFYTLTGEPGRPLQVQTASGAATLTVRGSLKATFGLLGSIASVQQDSAAGTVVLKRGGSQQTLTLSEAGPGIAPIGRTAVACTATTLVLTSPQLQFTLKRI